MGNLLIIASDSADRSIVRSRLSDAGHHVSVAQHLELEDCEGEGIGGLGYDCILIAAQPGEEPSGVDTCRALCSERFGVVSSIYVPVIVYSLLHENEGLVQRALEAGAHAVVTSSQGDLLESIVEASLASARRLATLKERESTLRSQQRRMSERLAGEQGSEAEPRLTSCPTAALIANDEGRVRSASRDARIFLGADCAGAHLDSILPDADLGRFAFSSLWTPLHDHRFEVTTSDGAEHAGWASSYPLVSGGTCIFLAQTSGVEESVGGATVLVRAAVQNPLLQQAGETFGLDRIRGRGPVATRLRQSIVTHAQGREPVLLVGERGSGRALLARILHYQSVHRDDFGPFFSLKCRSLQAKTLERELLGSDRSGFDGIHRPGLLALAGEGSVLLEEIDCLPAELQVRLAEILRSGMLPAGGSRTPPPLRARVVATTSADLGELAARGLVSLDLAEILLSRRIEVPALRNRGAELESIIDEALEMHGITAVEEDVRLLLRQYPWPGNYEELERVMRILASRAGGGPVTRGHLPQAFEEVARECAAAGIVTGDRPVPAAERGGHRPPWAITSSDPISFEFYQKQAIVRALYACRGDRLKAARLLRVGKSTLYRRIREFGIG